MPRKRTILLLIKLITDNINYTPNTKILLQAHKYTHISKHTYTHNDRKSSLLRQSLAPAPPPPQKKKKKISFLVRAAAGKRCVLRLDLKDWVKLTCIWIRREFQTGGTWHWKDLAPALFKCTCGTIVCPNRIEGICRCCQWQINTCTTNLNTSGPRTQ